MSTKESKAKQNPEIIFVRTNLPQHHWHLIQICWGKKGKSFQQNIERKMFNKILDEEDVQQKARIDFNPISAGLKLVDGIITKTSKSLLIPRLESSLLHRLFLVFSKSFFKGFFRRLVLSLSLSLALH